MRELLLSAALAAYLLGVPGAALAQSFTGQTYVNPPGCFAAAECVGPVQSLGAGQPVNPNTGFLQVGSTDFRPGLFIPQYSYLPLSAFASSSDVANLQQGQAGLNARVTALEQVQANSQMLAWMVRRDRQRAAEGTALAGALTILPPEAGGKLAISVGGASYEGTPAASVSATFRFQPGVLGYVGVARSQSQTLVKGGASFTVW